MLLFFDNIFRKYRRSKSSSQPVDTDKDGLEARVAALLIGQVERDAALAAMASELAARQEALARLEALQRDTESELAPLQAALDTALAERDAALASAEIATSRVAALEEEGKALAAERKADSDKLNALERLVEEQDLRFRLAHEELHRAEGQIGMLRELFLQDAKL